jgi:hypothetical protein
VIVRVLEFFMKHHCEKVVIVIVAKGFVSEGFKSSCRLKVG